MKHNKYDLKSLGNRITMERNAIGMTQETLMNALRDRQISLSRSSMYKIEHGERCDSLTIDMMFALCDIFECDMGYLLCEEGYEDRTRKATDVVKATGLTSEAVRKLIEWNEPSVMTTGDVEREVRLKALEDRVNAVSMLIEDGRFCGALASYLYRPNEVGTVYTLDAEGSRFSHSPSLVVMDNVQINATLVEQALLNAVTDAVKDMRKESRNG